MKRNAPDHPKTMDLQQRLGVSRATCVGLLELLWHWTAKYAPAGDVGRWPNTMLATGAGWDGNADAFVEALIEARYLDRRDDEVRLYVHGWHEHADDSVNLALYRAVKRFANGDMPKCSRLKKDDRAKYEPLWNLRLAEEAKERKRTASASRAHDQRFESALPSLAKPSLAPPGPLPEPRLLGEPPEAALGLAPADAAALDQPTAGNDGNGDEPSGEDLLEALEYQRAVADTAELLLNRRPRANERDLVEGWHRKGIPLRVVLSALRETVQTEPGRPVREPRSLQYFGGAVQEAFERWQRATGLARAGPAAPRAHDAAVQSWALVREHLQRVVPQSTWDAFVSESHGWSIDGQKLLVMVPVPAVASWLRTQLAEQVAWAVRDVGLTCQVDYLAERQAAG